MTGFDTLAQQEANSTLGSGRSSSSGRMENTVATLPIVYGSIAFPLHNTKKQQATVDSTHEWTLYLRGPNNEDLSQCIDKAVFHLHPSFAKPVRELTAPPYQVTERGWGEFEAQIKIYWKGDDDDNNNNSNAEQCTGVTHGIKLYPPPPTAQQPPPPPDAPVLAESYDEVVFTNPTERFFGRLQQVPQVPTLSLDEKLQPHFPPSYSDADHFLALLEAKKFLDKELNSVKERLDGVDRDLERADVQLKEAQEKAQAAAAAVAGGTTTTRKQAAHKGAAAPMPLNKKAKTAAASTKAAPATTTTTAAAGKGNNATATTTATKGGNQKGKGTKGGGGAPKGKKAAAKQQQSQAGAAAAAANPKSKAAAAAKSKQQQQQPKSSSTKPPPSSSPKPPPPSNANTTTAPTGGGSNAS